MKEQALLELQNLHVHYGGVKALDGVNLVLREREVVALMGPNGAGKSTILKVIFGLAPIEAGEIFWQGKLLKPISYEVADLGVSFVPQGRRVFRHLTVQENLELGGVVIKNKAELSSRISEVMETFPALRQKRRAKSGSLSGGQQQMLALARGLMSRPKVLLLDEPSLGLSPRLVKEIFAKIQEINQRHQTAILVVEHNIKSLLDIVHRAYILDKGRVLAQGSKQELIQSGFLEKVFLGKLE